MVRISRRKSYEQANRQSAEMKRDNQASVHKFSELKPQTNRKNVQHGGSIKNTLTAVMNMNNCSVHVDSGKQTNTIHKKYVRKEQVRPSSSTLCVIDLTPLKTLRVVHLPVSNPKSNKVMHITFAVVCNELQSLLGLQVIQKMNLITVNDEMFI